MTFDYTYFGYGVGFVMLGWAVGMVISAVFSIFSKVDRI